MREWNRGNDRVCSDPGTTGDGIGITAHGINCGRGRFDRRCCVMLNTIQKNIIIRALCIRKDAGEDPKKIIGNYHKLSSEEKMEILDEIGVKENKS